MAVIPPPAPRWQRRSPFWVVLALCGIAACGGDDDLEQVQNVDHIPDGALLDRRPSTRRDVAPADAPDAGTD
jgi:hypothetical protein